MMALVWFPQLISAFVMRLSLRNSQQCDALSRLLFTAEKVLHQLIIEEETIYMEQDITEDDPLMWEEYRYWTSSDSHDCMLLVPPSACSFPEYTVISSLCNPTECPGYSDVISSCSRRTWMVTISISTRRSSSSSFIHSSTTTSSSFSRQHQRRKNNNHLPPQLTISL